MNSLKLISCKVCMDKGDRQMRAELERFMGYCKVLAMSALGILVVAPLTGCGHFDGVYETDAGWQLFYPKAGTDCEADPEAPADDAGVWNNLNVYMKTANNVVITGEADIPGVDDRVPFEGTSVPVFGVGEVVNARIIVPDYYYDLEGLTLDCEFHIQGSGSRGDYIAERFVRRHGTINRCKVYQSGSCYRVLEFPSIIGTRIGDW